MAQIKVQAHYGHAHEKTIWERLKEQGKIPASTYFYYPLLLLKEALRLRLKEQKMARRVYEKLHLEVWLHGGRISKK